MLRALPHMQAKVFTNLCLSDGLSLSKGRVHEVMGTARTSFAALVAGQLSGPVIWIGREKDVGSINPCALSAFIHPEHILRVACISRKEVLWAAEQALRSAGVAGVISELAMGPSLTESRRLQLAAEEGGGLGLILISGRAQTSSAQTRWDCTPVMTPDQTTNWQWDLIKNKMGQTGAWQVKWQGRDHAPNYVRLASATAA